MCCFYERGTPVGDTSPRLQVRIVPEKRRFALDKFISDIASSRASSVASFYQVKTSRRVLLLFKPPSARPFIR